MLIEFVKSLVEPDIKKINHLFDIYEVKQNDYNTLLFKIRKEAIECENLKALENLSRRINFVISAKKFYERLELKKGQKLVQLKLDIDNKVSKELQIF